jgi:hypothetical protein
MHTPILGHVSLAILQFSAISIIPPILHTPFTHIYLTLMLIMDDKTGHEGPDGKWSYSSTLSLT